jgi:hypothetical protein
MKIVIHTFGTNNNFYSQSTFLILNLLQNSKEIDSINVVTDHPDYYKKLEQYINIITVDENTINLWKGEYGFVFRVKLKAIELVLRDNENNEPVLYLDTDTFIYRGFNELKKILSAGKGIMHINEGKLSECPTMSGLRMWKRIRNKAFGGNTITENDSMWNAGVIGLPGDKCNQIIETSIKMVDDMCSKIPLNFLIEQFCVSVALQRMVDVEAASGCIGHYWGNRDSWNNLISSFLTESYMKNYSIEDNIERMSDFNFGQIPIAVIPKNTEVKLHNLVTKYFKPKVYQNLQ